MDIQFFIGLDKFDLSDFVGNSEWRVIEAPAVRTNNKYDCCDAPYPDLTFSLKLRRLSTYYSYVFISPAVAVSLLIPFMFLLPASSRQKIQLGGSHLFLNFKLQQIIEVAGISILVMHVIFSGCFIDLAEKCRRISFYIVYQLLLV